MYTTAAILYSLLLILLCFAKEQMDPTPLPPRKKKIDWDRFAIRVLIGLVLPVLAALLIVTFINAYNWYCR